MLLLNFGDVYSCQLSFINRNFVFKIISKAASSLAKGLVSAVPPLVSVSSSSSSSQQQDLALRHRLALVLIHPLLEALGPVLAVSATQPHLGLEQPQGLHLRQVSTRLEVFVFTMYPLPLVHPWIDF